MDKIHQIQTWLIEHTRDIVNMYYFEGLQNKKALAYLAGGSHYQGGPNMIIPMTKTRRLRISFS